MSFFVATVGELVIVELCVLWIWFKVLFDALRNKDGSLAHKKLLMTSLGLVLNAAAITGIMIFRLAEYITGFWPFVPGIVACYVMLALGNIMFIVSAAVGSNARTFKVFLGLTFVWTVFCLVIYYGEMELPL